MRKKFFEHHPEERPYAIYNLFIPVVLFTYPVTLHLKNLPECPG